MERHVPRLEVTVWTPAMGLQDAAIYGRAADGGTLDLTDWIITLQTSTHVAQPCGTWSMTLAPRQGTAAQWDDLIPLFSVVKIALWRPLVEEPQNIMLGLVESVAVSESYGSAAVHRTFTLGGREASALLIHNTVCYFPTTDDAAVQGQTPGAPSYDIGDLVRGMMFDERLLQVDAPPPQIIKRLFDAYVGAIDLGIPRFTDQTIVSQRAQDASGARTGALETTVNSVQNLLRFDPSKATMFDPDARITIPHEFRGEGPLWSILASFVDPVFQEFFCRTAPFEPVVDVVFRARPFSADPQLGRRGGLFDLNAVETVTVTADDIIGEQLSRGTAELFTGWWVMPAQVPYAPGGQVGTDLSFRTAIPPILDLDPDSPAYVRRFGLRLMQAHTRYFPLPDGDGDLRDAGRGMDVLRAKSSQWSKILRSWHRYNGLLWSGALSLKGRASYRVGTRLIAPRRQGGTRSTHREFYVQGVSHAYEARNNSFRSSAHVVRGYEVEGDAVELPATGGEVA